FVAFRKAPERHNVMMRNKTTTSPVSGGRWFWPAWGCGVPWLSDWWGGRHAAGGSVESVGAALIAGAIAGGVIGAAQWLVLRRRLPLSHSGCPRQPAAWPWAWRLARC